MIFVTPFVLLPPNVGAVPFHFVPTVLVLILGLLLDIYPPFARLLFEVVIRSSYIMASRIYQCDQRLGFFLGFANPLSKKEL